MSGLQGPHGTLVDLVCERAGRLAQRRAYLYLESGEREGPALSYAALDLRARQIAAVLRDAGLAGQPVLLLYPPGLEFIAAFFGCLYAGAIAVPAYPPDPARLARSLARLQAIAADAGAPAVLTTGQLAAMARVVLGDAPYLAGLRWLVSDGLTGDPAWRRPDLAPSSIAFLQYTSGSTGTPRGVVLTHGNLLHNQGLIQQAFQLHAASVVVGWLPLYHDMGLIGNVLQTVHLGATCVLMSPLDCLQRPARWLQAITRYGGTISGGPNFAFDLCTRKVSDAERATLELASWDAALNGAEPVRPETMARFAERFAGVGFRRAAFRPCYGLAEASLIVAAADARGPRTLVVDKAALERGEIVAAEGAGDASTAAPTGGSRDGSADRTQLRPLASSGVLLGDQQVRIADPVTGAACAPGQVGEIWVAGGSVAQGYWRSPESTAASFGARLGDAPGAAFLRTGDLGFLHEAELFITGRIKDLIILRGRNHYPQDLERTVEASHPALRPGCGAAFAVEGPAGEALVIVQELDARRTGEAADALAAIRAALARGHEVEAHAIVLVAAGTVPKTSSGKLQRAACRISYLEGRLAPIAASTVADAAPAAGVAAANLKAAPKTAAPTEAAVLVALRAIVARRLRVAPGELRGDQPLVEHGLDSMTAIELIADLEPAVGAVATLSDLLGGISLDALAANAAALAARVAAGDAALEVSRTLAGTTTSDEPAALTASMAVNNAGWGRARPVAGAVADGEPVPLSPGAEAMWFLAELAPESAAYNVAGAAVIRGALDVAALVHAFGRLVARHAALRTIFPAPAGRPVQQVLGEGALDVQLLDGRAWRAEELQAALRAEADRPFRLRSEPPFRVRIVARGAGEHVLLIAAHHVVVDLWSIAVVLRELGPLYAAELAGAPAALPPLALAPADVARWQVAIQRADEPRLLAYWRAALDGAPAALELPTDRPRPAHQTYRGASVRHAIPAALADRLRALARAQGTTLYTVLLAGFQAVLHRHARTADLVVGTSIAGRAEPALHDLVGYFVNPVAIRSQLAPGARFAELVAGTRRRVLDAIAHHALPFPLLVERLRPARDPARSPVFQVYFVYQDVPFDAQIGRHALGWAGAPFALGPLALELVELARDVAPFELTLMMAATGGGELGCALQYNADLFDAATAAELLAHLETLLAAAAADPQRTVETLPLVSAAQRAQLLAAPAAHVPPGLPLHRRFEHQVRRAPDAPAITCDGETWSYAKLDDHASRIAAALRAAGVGAETRVGLCLARSPALIAGVIGILKAGGAYLPLDPAYPADRLAYMLADSGARVVVSDARHAAQLDAPGLHVIAIDALPAAAAPSGAPEVSVEQLAYILYTSGSTGRPKGTLVCHAQVTRLLDATQAWFAFGPDDVWSVFHSISFDFSVWEIWGALIHGGRLVMVPHEVSRSPRELHALLVRERVTVLNQTPSAFRPLSAADAGAPGELALRTIIFGGEPLELETLRGWVDRHGDATPVLVNMYGITETCVHVTYRVIRRADLARRTTVIGEPIPDLAIHVVDDALEPVPLGVTGEIFVAGAGLARGYHARPALTAERFVPDPYGAPGSRRYRSGDLARRTHDGELEYLGRRDDQVKIRGFRIELGEIEAAILRQPGVGEARVVARDAAGGGKRLVAYVVARGAALTPAAVRGAVAEHVPDYMVPAVVIVAALPLTPNGKLDVRALPLPEQVAAEPDAQRAPADELEHRLAAVWAEVLGVERLAVDDDFFALGGHSLLASTLVARLNDQLGLALELRELFGAPSVARLAAVIRDGDAGAGRAAWRTIVADNAAADGAAAPLADAQARLWFLSALEPASPAYNIPAALRLVGPLDAAALARSLREIVRRHQTLRTRVANVHGAPVPQLDPEAAPVIWLDVRAADDPDREAHRIATTDARRGFDLAAEPPLRARVVRIADDVHLLVLTLHHIAFDGASQGVLAGELAALYAAFAAGGDPPLPPLALQYADYARWHRRWLASGVLDAQLAYWTARLAGAPGLLALPTDRPRPAQPTGRGASHAVAIAPSAVAALEAVCRREGATLAMGVQAVFAVLLGRHAAEDDLLLGIPMAGRIRPELRALIGMFVNTLVLRVDLGRDPTFREVLARVRGAALAAYAHGDAPFDRVVEAVRPGRDRARTPLVQAVCALQAAPTELALPGLAVTQIPLDTGTAKFELMLTLEPAGGGLRGAIEYATDLFDAATIARLAAHLALLIDAAVAAPDVAIAGLALVTPDERAVIAAANATTADVPAGRLEAWVAAHALHTPDAIAIAADAGTLSYAMLDRRARGLARRLRGLGVGPGARIAICVERSAALPIAMLGILHAGATYAPLDPGLPVDRLHLLLDDLAARVVVTQPSLAARVAGAGRSVIVLDAAGEADDAVGLPDDAVRADAGEVADRDGAARGTRGDAAAYVIYTSGSTGRPKGVVVGHRAAGNTVAWYARRLGLGVGVRAAWIAPVAFDMSGLEIWAALAAGATLVLPTDDARLDPARLVRWLADARVDVAFVPTPLVAPMLEQPLPASLGLRWLVTGGTRLTVRPPRAARFALLNAYGPTECAVMCTAAVVAPASGAPGGAAAPSIGGPIANIQAYVVDRALREVPFGAIGELVIGGAGLAHGYLARAAVTAASFVPDPWSGVAGARLYRTGDLVRRRADGGLDYIGRRDAQVKLRGHRVELGEIEHALRAHPEVRAAAVRLWEIDGDQALVAYVVWTGSAPAEPVLRDALATRLPAYMVPAQIVELAALPRTAHDKLDVAALPPPPRRAGQGARPRSAAEDVVAAAFGEVLRADDVGLEDSFFALGGHSLAAMKLVALVSDRLGVELELRALFEAPTVAGLAARAAAAPARRAVVRDDRARYPLAFAQQRLWFIDRLGTAGAAYHLATAFHLEGGLDRAALAASLDALVARHAQLRVRVRDGEQVIEPVDDSRIDPTSGPLTEQGTGRASAQALGAASGQGIGLPRFALAVHDLSAIAPDQRRAAAHALALDEARRPFALDSAPAIRGALYVLAPEDHVLCLVAHHLVADGLSVARLFTELAAGYHAALAGEPIRRDPPRASYADFVAWQRAWLAGDQAAAQLAYWTGALAGAPLVLELPADHPRPEVQSMHGAVHRFAFAGAPFDQLCALARDEATTPFVALLAVYAAVLARHAGQDDLLIGTPVAGRPRPELLDVVGMFAETLVLRATLAGQPSLRALVRRLRTTTLDALGHAELPFDRLVEALRPPRDLSRSPVVQVTFAYQDGLADLPALRGLRTTPWELDLATAQFDLSLRVERRADGAEAALAYSTALFAPDTAARLAGDVVRLLAVAAAQPDVPLVELPLLDAGERAALLAGAVGAPLGEPRDVLAAFWAHVVRTPDAVAVVGRAGAGAGRGEALGVAGHDEVVSYGMLGERASRLAHQLRGLGVTRDRCVGVYLERGAAAIVALIAILEAGAGYVPLDPAWPAERVRFALQDARAACVVSREPLLATLGELACPTVALDRDAAAIAARPSTRIAQALAPDALAYVIYTSGSTGRPKGVAVSRGNLAASTAARRVAYGAPVRGYLVLSSLAFDSSVAGVFWTLTDGGALVVPPDDGWGGAAALGALIAAHGVSHLLAIPGLYQELIAQIPDALAALEVAIVAGEACPAALVARHLAALPGVRLYNEYGPTEATVWSTLHACTAAPDARVPIGRPIPGAAVYVLDARLEPVPRGSLGEIFIGGPGVARGYVGQPGLTAARFIPDPHGAPGARLYCTGDLGRLRGDGAIEFFGRTDHQVKLRGLRIELGEIEARLRELDGIADAAVAVHAINGEPRLVGYLAGPAVRPDAAIRDHLRARLPAGWMPASWVRLAALPRGSNGKLDRRRLPVPAFDDAPSSGDAFVAPRAGLEAAIAAIWCDVLKLPRVGTRDSFFDLGGHSLLLFQVQQRLRDQLAREVPIVELFRHATVERLAAALEAAPSDAVPDGSPGGSPGTPTDAPGAARERAVPRVQQLAQRRRRDRS